MPQRRIRSCCCRCRIRRPSLQPDPAGRSRRTAPASLHQLKRDALVGLNTTPDPAIILLWHVPLWNVDEEMHGKAQCRQEAEHDETRPSQGPAQRAVVDTQYCSKGLL